MSTATAVKTRPIRLNDDEVRSVLTMPEVVLYLPIKLDQFQRPETPGYDWTFRCKRGLWQEYREVDLIAQRCPHGKPGDRLFLKESFYCDDYRYPDAPHSELLEAMEYRASHDCADWEAGCPCKDGAWMAATRMPRWASRITFEILSVGIQQLAVENLWILSLRRLESSS